MDSLDEELSAFVRRLNMSRSQLQLNPKEEITSLAMYLDTLYVGTSYSTVLLVHLNKPEQANPFAEDGQRSRRSSSSSSRGLSELATVPELGARVAVCSGKKRVTGLYVMPALDTLLVLCDGRLFCLNLASNEVTTPLKKVRNVDAVAVQGHANCRSVVVAAKRQLIYLLHEDGRFVRGKEVSLPDAATSLCWRGKHVCVALKKRRYILLNIETGECSDLHVPLSGPDDRSVRAQVASVSHDQIILRSAHGALFVFLKWDGTLATRAPIEFSSAPLQVVVCGMYLAGVVNSISDSPSESQSDEVLLDSEGRIEIFSLEDSRMVQSFPFPLPATLWSPTLNASTADATSHSRAKVPHFAAFSPHGLRVLATAPLMDQVRQFLRRLRVEEAQTLIYSADPPPPQDEFRYFHEQAGLELFGALRFSDALKHLEIARVDPRELLFLFPSVRDTVYLADHTDDRKISDGDHADRSDGSDGDRSDRKWRSEFDFFGACGNRLDLIIDAGLQRLQDQQQHRSPGTVAHGSATRGRGMTFAEQAATAMQSYERFRAEALFALCAFLWQWRYSHLEEDLPLQSVVDTALLLLQIELLGMDAALRQSLDAADLPSVERLLFPRNAVVVSAVRERLMQAKEYYLLSQVLSSKGLPAVLQPGSGVSQAQATQWLDEALSLWTQLSAGELVDVHGDTRSLRDAVATLSQLGAEDADGLLWKYAGRLCRISAQEGLKIFTSSSRTVSLDVARVADFLSFDNALRLAYLEHVVMILRLRTPRCHDLLAEAFLVAVSLLTEDTHVPLESLEASHVRYRLAHFLLTSMHYSRKHVLQKLAALDGFAEEKIIVLAKLERHRDVLQHIMLTLKDIDAALEFCSDGALVFLPLALQEAAQQEAPSLSSVSAPQRQTGEIPDDLEVTRDVQLQATVPLKEVHLSQETHARLSRKYSELLPDLVTPRCAKLCVLLDVVLSQERSDALDDVLDIVENHARDLSPSLALALLPDDAPISLFNEFLRQSMPQLGHAMRSTRIRLSLTRLRALNAKLKWLKAREPSVLLDGGKHSKCPVCLRAVMPSTWFKVFAKQGVAVHYHCADRFEQMLQWREDGDTDTQSLVEPEVKTPSVAARSFRADTGGLLSSGGSTPSRGGNPFDSAPAFNPFDDEASGGSTHARIRPTPAPTGSSVRSVYGHGRSVYGHGRTYESRNPFGPASPSGSGFGSLSDSRSSSIDSDL